MKKSLLLCLLFISIGYFSAGAQKDNISYIFGHSLINHEWQVNVTPSDETSVPHWLFYLSQAGGHNYKVSGQYGFLTQHINLPPSANWSFDSPQNAWDSGAGQSFESAGFTNVLITPANFIQWTSPTSNYTNQNYNPIDATETVLNWAYNEDADVNLYIYENWPEMGAYAAGFPPTQQEWNSYNNYLLNGFHDWFIEYQDSVTDRMNGPCVKMIPTGPGISELLLQSPYNQIPIDSLYEDSDPHGRPNIYFLASLITYMATYEEKAPSKTVFEAMAPANYTDNTIIHPIIRDNYTDIVNTLWDYLLAFDYPTGESRVFCQEPIILPINLLSFDGEQSNDGIMLSWTTTSEWNNAHIVVERSYDGQYFEAIGEVKGNGTIDFEQRYNFLDKQPHDGRNYYRLKQVDIDGSTNHHEVISLIWDGKSNETNLSLYPNPTQDKLSLSWKTSDQGITTIRIIDNSGRCIRTHSVAGNQSSYTLSVDVLPKGSYIIKLANNKITETKRFLKM